MTSSRALLATALLITAAAAAAFFSQAEATSAFCCLKFQTKPLPMNRVLSYEYTSSACHQPAVVFTTKAHKKICGDLSQEWVQNRVKQLERN